MINCVEYFEDRNRLNKKLVDKNYTILATHSNQKLITD